MILGAHDWLSADILNLSPVERVYDEIHVLSYFYHWDGEYCWSLPVTKREYFVWKIREQIKAENKAAKGGNKKGR